MHYTYFILFVFWNASFSSCMLLSSFLLKLLKWSELEKNTPMQHQVLTWTDNQPVLPKWDLCQGWLMFAVTLNEILYLNLISNKVINRRCADIWFMRSCLSWKAKTNRFSTGFHNFVMNRLWQKSKWLEILALHKWICLQTSLMQPSSLSHVILLLLTNGCVILQEKKWNSVSPLLNQPNSLQRNVMFKE